MITALVPCFNAERYLGDAIESILAQTRPVDQLIVVDDCSTDASRDVARQRGARLIQTAVNSGHAAARNLGIETADGDLIAWLDADDYWEPNHVESLAGMLERFPEAAVAFSAVRFVGDRAGIVWSQKTGSSPVNRFWDCLKETIVPAMSAVTRREPLVAIGGFDAGIRIAPDFDLWLRLSRHNLFVNTEDVTSNYRWHATQISTQPERQVQSLYESRWRYLQAAAGVESQEFCQALCTRMVEIWDGDLLAAWHRRNFEHLKFLLTLGRFLPQTTATARQLRWKSLVPKSVLLAWDWIT